MKEYDSIVIGSGIGGLVAAGRLVNAGYKVLVLEKNHVAGGYLQSFKRRGFTFDSCVDCFSGLDKDGPIRSVLDGLGITEEIETIRLDPIRLSLYPDFRVTVHADLDNYIEELSSLFPGEVSGLRAFFSVVRAIYSDIKDWSDNLIGTSTQNKMPLNIVKYGKTTYATLLDSHISDPLLKSVLSDRCPFYGLPPSKVGAVSMTALIMSYFSSGAYRVKGGNGRLADILVDGIRNKGSEVRFNTEVIEIITEKNRAVAIKIDEATEFRADHIISNIDYRTTASMLLKSSGGKERSAKREVLFEPSSSFFILYIGGKVDLSSFTGASSIGVFPSNDMEYNFKRESYFSPDASIGITIPTMLDSSMAPTGMHSIAAHEMVDYSFASSWKEVKPELMKRTLRKLEKIIPGISSGAVHIEAATPETLKRYTGNTNGAAYGWTQVPELRQVTTSTTNLYFAGHWEGTGGGVVAAAYSGLKAAKEIEASTRGGTY